MTEATPRAGRPVVVLALPNAGAAPLDVVAGLPIALRAVLVLQRLGATRVTVAVAPGDTAVREALTTEPRLAASTSFVEADSAAGALRAIASGEPLLVAPHDALAAQDVYRALLTAPLDGALAILPSDAAEPMPFVAAPALLERLGADVRLFSALATLAERGEARVLAPTPGWTASARTDAGRREAVRHLFDACRKPVDGLVSRYLNRHVSIFVSKRLVDTAVSPNAVTGVTFALGVAAALCVARASYGWMLLGAFLFQCNSILDGVDGELARVRLQGSKLGEWLDTVSDDLSNVLFYVATGYAASQLPEPGPTLAPMGYVAGGAGLLTMMLYYAELARLGRGDFYALDVGLTAPRPGVVGAVTTAVRYATKKDFFIMGFFIAAALGALPYALPVMMAGTLGTAAAGIGLVMRRLRS